MYHKKKTKRTGDVLMEINKIYNEDCLEGMKRIATI